MRTRAGGALQVTGRCGGRDACDRASGSVPRAEGKAYCKLSEPEIYRRGRFHHPTSGIKFPLSSPLEALGINGVDATEARVTVNPFLQCGRGSRDQRETRRGRRGGFVVRRARARDFGVGVGVGVGVGHPARAIVGVGRVVSLGCARASFVARSRAPVPRATPLALDLVDRSRAPVPRATPLALDLVDRPPPYEPPAVVRDRQRARGRGAHDREHAERQHRLPSIVRRLRGEFDRSRSGVHRSVERHRSR